MAWTPASMAAPPDSTASTTARELLGILRVVQFYGEQAERWDIELRFVHTPGVLLHRPDQTSRGDPIEEPRVRLAAAEFAAIERLTGRFTEFVGAERRHAAAEVGS